MDRCEARVPSNGQPLIPYLMSIRPWALAVLGGVLVWLGFAGIGLWPVALLAFVPLFVALELDAPQRGGRVVLLGLVFGTVAWGAGSAWILGTLRTFSGLPLPACLLIAILFWSYQGGLFALFGWLWWRARRRGVPAALAAAGSLAASELLYPQLLRSYHAASFHQVPIALQIADLGGPLLVGALCLAVNGALFELAASRAAPAARRAALVVLACVVASLLYGAVRLFQIDASSRDAARVRVGIVQPNMEAFSKWTKLDEGQKRLVEGTRQLERSVHADLILWPENAYPAGLPVALDRVPATVTGGTQTPILFGTVARTAGGGFNRVHLVDEHGVVLGTYDKVNLLAFGEYLPFEHALPWLRSLSRRSGRVHPGHGIDPLPYRGWRISALVCYEDTLPEFVRRVVRAGSPHLLVNLTNDAWFGDTDAPWIHLALSQLRAIEQRRYLVRATNTGVSAVIDPAGRVVARSGSFTRETLEAEVAMLEGRTPYQLLGDWPGWLGIAVIGWGAFLRRRVTGEDVPPPS